MEDAKTIGKYDFSYKVLAHPWIWAYTGVLEPDPLNTERTIVVATVIVVATGFFFLFQADYGEGMQKIDGKKEEE
jgi:hypothetical protein